MDRMVALVVTFSVLQELQAFNLESRAWKTMRSPDSPDGWFGYKVLMEAGSSLLVSDPLLQTSPTRRGRIYRCASSRCTALDPQVPEFAVNMSLGLTMAGDPASKRTMACGPTITRECKNINTYNGICLQIAPSNKLATPSTLKDCPGISDIAFLLDGSGSVSQLDFTAMKNFVKSLISSLRGAETRFAITQYSSTPRTHYYFNTFDLSGQWENEVNSINQLHGWTYTAAAIEEVVANVFSTSGGSRTNSKKVLIVITDGESNDHKLLKGAADGAERKGIIRFAIGVGAARTDELNTIGSKPTRSHVFHVSSFVALEQIRSALEESIFSIEGTQTGGSFKLEMAQEGFSAAYLPNGEFQMGSVGAYEWGGGFQRYSSYGGQTSQDNQLVEADSYLGYSMTVANTRAGPLTILGAPRYRHRGIVFVYAYDLSTLRKQTVDPSQWQRSQIGEYFGAEVATMALDPRTQYSTVVLIGAPLYTAGDSEGRVYVCALLAGVDCQFDEPDVLQGRPGERGRFGSSIAPLPDLNQDGVNDLAVGAPLENQGQGSVYIFHGDARGTINRRISQRVAGSDVKKGLRFFGLSISQGSSDRQPVLAVGSKGQVLLLRSRPIVMVKAQVSFNPSQIPPSTSDCKDNVTIKAAVCFTMSGQPSALTARINFTMSLDTTRKRAFFAPNVRERRETFILAQQGHCFDYVFFIEPCPEDSLNDLFNELTFSFDGLPSTDDLRPSLAEEATTTIHPPLGFKVNCENACEDQLQVGFNFSGSSTVRVGIDDLLNVTTSIDNLGEDSYYSQVLLTYPAGLSFRKFTALKGRVGCSSLDSENGVSLGKTTCLIYRPIFKSKAKAVFIVSYGVNPNSQLTRKILITANATSGNVYHAEPSGMYQREEIDVKYSVFLSIASSLGYTNFTYGRNDLHKPVVKPVKVLNFGRAFNVTVVIRVPVRLGDQHIWQEQENLEIPDCQRSGKEQPMRSDFVEEVQQNLMVDCAVASCLVFRCNMVMRRQQSTTFTIAANLSSGWIAQIGLTSAKFLLVSTASLEYDQDTYIFDSAESKHAPPVRKVVTEVEVYPEANFTKEIVGGTVGGLLLLALVAAGLYKAGFFKSRYKQMIEDAGGADGGGDGGAGGETGGEAQEG